MKRYFLYLICSLFIATTANKAFAKDNGRKDKMEKISASNNKNKNKDLDAYVDSLSKLQDKINKLELEFKTIKEQQLKEDNKKLKDEILSNNMSIILSLLAFVFSILSLFCKINANKQKGKKICKSSSNSAINENTKSENIEKNTLQSYDKTTEEQKDTIEKLNHTVAAIEDNDNIKKIMDGKIEEAPNEQSFKYTPDLKEQKERINNACGDTYYINSTKDSNAIVLEKNADELTRFKVEVRAGANEAYFDIKDQRGIKNNLDKLNAFVERCPIGGATNVNLT